MAKTRIPIPEALRLEVIANRNNRCCICQTPFVVIHHIDEDPSNNDLENLAPLCPNCHSQAHSSSQTTMNLSPSRISTLRDKWYEYCDRRRDSGNVSPNGVLKVKNFVHSTGFAQHGWSKTFSAIDPAYETLKRNEIINRVFATSNRDDLVTYLETMKYMYQNQLSDTRTLQRSVDVCNAFGIDYDDLG